ncbi:hypothetical protein ACNHKD_14575 [Methylocystis sp. JAN1]|uniref:hypothetical protein n=1 Tax=Methylocystis sp. JAN1 TaxID=3397211 RepID=UPI003FA23AF5
MRLSSLRVLILVLTMVMQTVAGGWGVARAATDPLEAGASAHCLKHDGTDVAGDARRDGRGQMCESCLLCAGPPSVSLDATFAPELSAPRAVTSAGFVFSNISSVAARILHARFARGPPAALLRA